MAKAEAVQQVHFSISGRFISEHAREIMLEGEWQDGLAILEYVENLNYDDRIAILKGEKILVGWDKHGKNTLRLVPERRHKSISKKINYLYAGTVRSRPGYWRPYAFVSNYGPEDIGCEPRAMHYADDRQKDKCRTIQHPKMGNIAVLFHRIGNPPPWWKPLTNYTQDWLTSVLQYEESGNELEERGYSRDYQLDDESEEYLKELAVINARRRSELPPTDRELDQEEANEEINQLANPFGNFSALMPGLLSSGLNPDAITGVLAAITGKQTPVDVAPQEDEMMDGDYGWVTRDGKYYTCQYHEHSALAERLFTHYFRDQAPTFCGDFGGDFQKAGDEIGWLRIAKSAISSECSAYCCKRPTEQQMDSLGLYCQRRKLNPDDVFKPLY